jgi:ABC-type amino acid transport substrate-binding protein
MILATTLNAKESSHTLSIYTMEQIPYGYITQNGRASGLLFEILDKIILESGLEIQNELVPAKRLELELLSKRTVCTLLADVPNIKGRFDLVEPIGYEFQSGLLPKVGIKLDSYSSLKGKILAVPNGIEFYDKFDDDNELSKVTPPKFINAIRMLKAGRVDAIAGSISVLKYIAQREGMFNDDFGEPLIFTRNNIHLVCSKATDKRERSILKRAVINLKLNGTIQKLLDKYLPRVHFQNQMKSIELKSRYANVQ